MASEFMVEFKKYMGEFDGDVFRSALAAGLSEDSAQKFVLKWEKRQRQVEARAKAEKAQEMNSRAFSDGDDSRDWVLRTLKLAASAGLADGGTALTASVRAAEVVAKMEGHLTEAKGPDVNINLMQELYRKVEGRPATTLIEG